jgi:predicted ATP-dependent endonuclease of OLD family
MSIATMDEKLIVRQFAGIASIDLDINKINIIIGPQASGKSVCAKLLFFFKSFIWQIIATVENEDTKRSLDNLYKKKFEEYFPPEYWGDKSFSIRYSIRDSYIEVSRKEDEKNKITLSYSDSYKTLLRDLRGINKKLKESISESTIQSSLRIPRNFLSEYLPVALADHFPQHASYSQLFIPAGRSFFANLQNSIFSFLSSSNALDPFLIEFGKLYEGYKSMLLRRADRIVKNIDSKNAYEEVDRLIEGIICAKHVRVKGTDYLVSSDGRRVNLSSSSSGQQETLPLAVILSVLPSIASRLGKTVYIEEPEAHLFPEAQRKIIELIALTFNLQHEKLQFIITTHSPYVLTAINNLLQGGMVYAANSEVSRKPHGILPQYKTLSPGSLNAYGFEKGKCISIIDSETGLIDARIIDSVSDSLAVEFDELISIG